MFGRGAAAAPRAPVQPVAQDITLALKIAETSVEGGVLLDARRG